MYSCVEVAKFGVGLGMLLIGTSANHTRGYDIKEITKVSIRITQGTV